MTKLEREAYINVICKYRWILSVITGVSYYRNVIEHALSFEDSSYLERYAFEMYKELKCAIRKELINRRDRYYQNKLDHVEQKTCEKQFMRFLEATGYTIDNPSQKLPIRRLIKIYSVYFKDLGKLKRDLDKKNESPYIG